MSIKLHGFMGLYRRQTTGFEQHRRELVKNLRRNTYIRTDRVQDAMLRVPRELFVPGSLRSNAYMDRPLSIGLGQTISAPHMVAIMSEALELEGGEKVLEIGAGSGYHAAVTAELVGKEGRVFSVERHPELASAAEDALMECGLGDRVKVITGDGSVGLPREAPFQRIYVTCAAPALPRPLLDQMSPGGILLVPEGRSSFQQLIRYRIPVEMEGKDGDATPRDPGKEKLVNNNLVVNKNLERENLGSVIFVPLVGEHGFR